MRRSTKSTKTLFCYRLDLLSRPSTSFDGNSQSLVSASSSDISLTLLGIRKLYFVFRLPPAIPPSFQLPSFCTSSQASISYGLRLEIRISRSSAHLGHLLTVNRAFLVNAPFDLASQSSLNVSASNLKI